jgi:hypothetical protein
MSKIYKLTALCTISIQTNVTANSLEEAIEIANQRQDIMHEQYEHPDENEHWCADEYDGVPFNIGLRED